MTERRLLLIGWDAADWSLLQPLLAKGALPALARLVEQGVSGPLESLVPEDPAALWTSLATGKQAFEHGVLSAAQDDALEEGLGPVSSRARHSKALWQLLGERGLRSHVVGWPATGGERGFPGSLVCREFVRRLSSGDAAGAAATPASAKGCWPPSLAVSLGASRCAPEQFDLDELSALFGLRGEDMSLPPEVAHACARDMAEALTVHGVFNRVLDLDPDWNLAAVHYGLLGSLAARTRDADMAPSLRQQMLSGVCRLLDRLLSQLLQRADGQTAVMVVSQRGLPTPAGPAAASGLMRQPGILAAAGAGLAREAALHSARLLDLTPTILAWFDLPVGADMPGRVLRAAFVSPPPVRVLPSWEAGGPLVPEPGETAAAQRAQRALGHLDIVPGEALRPPQFLQRQRLWARGRALLDAGELERALPLLEDLHFLHADHAGYAHALALCQLRLGLVDEAALSFRACPALAADPQLGRLLEAWKAIAAGQPAAAAAQLSALHHSGVEDSQLLGLMAQTLMRLRRRREAAALARDILARNPDDLEARLVLARCALAAGRPDEAAEEARRVLIRRYNLAAAHFLLGVALCQSARLEAAVTALRMAVALSEAPQKARAQRYLSRVLARMGDPVEAWDLQLWESGEDAGAAGGEPLQTLARLRQQARTRHSARVADRRQRRQAGLQRSMQSFHGLPPDQEFVIVSGLPRSGTSLMMQMLEAGGLPVLTDGIRGPDEDNVHGYYEWEALRRLAREPLVIERAHGRVVKVLSDGLLLLPDKHRYKVLYMRRPLREVAASQSRMRESRGSPLGVSVEELERTLAHLAHRRLEQFLKTRRAVVLEVDYPALVADPHAGAMQAIGFLGRHRVARPAAMAGCVKPALYRQRV